VASGIQPVAVIPEFLSSNTSDFDTVSSPFPFPLDYVALCMLRVLSRAAHPSLDARTAVACRVVMMFACFFLNFGSLRELVEPLCPVISVPILRSVNASGTLALSATAEARLSLIRGLILRGAANMASLRGSSLRPDALPDSWEAEMRAALLGEDEDTRAISAALFAMQLPVNAILEQLLVKVRSRYIIFEIFLRLF
jgi:hypothetical protein